MEYINEVGMSRGGQRPLTAAGTVWGVGQGRQI